MLRPHMTAAHLAFSGEWSRDRASVLAALRAAREQHPPDRIAPLTRAVKDNRRVHMAVDVQHWAADAGMLVLAGGSVRAPAGAEFDFALVEVLGELVPRPRERLNSRAPCSASPRPGALIDPMITKRVKSVTPG